VVLDNSKKNICIFDQSGIKAQLRKTYFERQGCLLNIVDSEEALNGSITKEMPDLVILDHAKDVDCAEICREIKSNPATWKTKVLLILNGLPEKAKIRAATSKCDDFLVEPVKVEELLAATSKILNIKARRHIRVFIKIECRLGRNEKPIFGETTDISLSGLFVRLYEKLEEGSRVQLEFRLPGYEKFIACSGKIIRMDENVLKPDFGVGVQFEGLAPVDSMFLREFVEGNSD
jgi:DNA-binding response OmpR family regulator